MNSSSGLQRLDIESESFLIGSSCGVSLDSLGFLLLSSMELRVLLNLLKLPESARESLVLVQRICVWFSLCVKLCFFCRLINIYIFLIKTAQIYYILLLLKIMLSYKIGKLGHSLVNLLTAQSIISQNLIKEATKTTQPTIVTTVEHDTHTIYARELDQISTNKLVRFVPFHLPLIYAHYSKTNLTFANSANPQGVSLLIGDNNEHFINGLDRKKMITLQELCKAVPEKVPLSNREKSNAQFREQLSQLIGMKMGGQKVIQFEHLLIMNPNIKMWDQAFQVILDCQPTPLYIPYLKEKKVKDDQLYRLTLKDFIEGLKKVHQTVSSAVKTHPTLNIIEFDQRRQLDWIISQIASDAKEMRIDINFFRQTPKVKGCSGPVTIVDNLKQVI